MAQRKGRSRQDRSARVPLTIGLDRQRYEFVLQVAKLREFRSLDDFFEAALSVYERHLLAAQEYVAMQEANGLTRDEAIEAVQCEIVFTRPQA